MSKHQSPHTNVETITLDTTIFCLPFPCSVLQRNKALNLWGFGQVLNGTRVCLGKDCVLATPSPSDSLWASSLGSRWTASLPARPASSDPQTLVLVDPRGRIVQQLDDLVVGDVFLFSGQVGFKRTRHPVFSSEAASRT